MEHGLKRKSLENGDYSHLIVFSLDDLNEDLLECSTEETSIVK